MYTTTLSNPISVYHHVQNEWMNETEVLDTPPLWAKGLRETSRCAEKMLTVPTPPAIDSFGSQPHCRQQFIGIDAELTQVLKAASQQHARQSLGFQLMLSFINDALELTSRWKQKPELVYTKIIWPSNNIRCAVGTQALSDTPEDNILKKVFLLRPSVDACVAGYNEL